MQTCIYLDNASTSFPKAPGVGQAMLRFIEEVGCNVNRGEYQSAYSAAEMVLDTRERLCALFHAPNSRNILFTANITQALNMVIKGFLNPGDHVLVTSMEHNAAMRPLVQMERQGVSFDRIPCDGEGRLRLETVENMIRPETRMILATHASNICGVLMPIEELGSIARAHGLRFVVDAAQTAGVFPIDMAAMGIDALCFTGHKGLLGPQGIGGMALTNEMAASTRALLSGGTGSLSDTEETPNFLPDKFEPGTPNLPGIYGLNAALQYIEQTGMDAIRLRELSLINRLHDAIAALPGLRLFGGPRAPGAAILSVDFAGRDNAEIALRLSEEFQIMTRCGMHCAPHAHKTLGTFPEGTVRFSVSHFNDEQEIDACVRAIETVIKE